MKGETIRARRLRQAGIETIPVTAEFLAAYEDRTCGFLEARWPGNPDHLREAMRLYGMDCYMQGLIDASSHEVRTAINQLTEIRCAVCKKMRYGPCEKNDCGFLARAADETGARRDD